MTTLSCFSDLDHIHRSDMSSTFILEKRLFLPVVKIRKQEENTIFSFVNALHLSALLDPTGINNRTDALGRLA